MRAFLSVLTFIGAVVLVLALRACYIGLEQHMLATKAEEQDEKKKLEMCKRETKERILTELHCKFYLECTSYNMDKEVCIKTAHSLGNE